MARPVAVTEVRRRFRCPVHCKAPAGDMVAKALSLLDLLGEYPHGGSLSDLSARSGFPLSTTHRLLASLIRGGYASAADSDRRYHLGLRVFALGQQVASARGFAGTVLPQMEWLAEQTAEAVLMSVLDGDSQLYVHYVSGPQQVGVIGERGRHGPLHCTAMGKVLVAFAPVDQSRRLVETVDLRPLGPHTITDRDAFRAEIEVGPDERVRDRRRGARGRHPGDRAARHRQWRPAPRGDFRRRPGLPL